MYIKSNTAVNKNIHNLLVHYNMIFVLQPRTSTSPKSVPLWLSNLLSSEYECTDSPNDTTLSKWVGTTTKSISTNWSFNVIKKLEIWYRANPQHRNNSRVHDLILMWGSVPLHPCHYETHNLKKLMIVRGWTELILVSQL